MVNEIIGLVPEDHDSYTERKTAKAVIINDLGQAFQFKYSLIGGGLEPNESYEEALFREAIEEAGITVEILRPLGDVKGYRTLLKKKYVSKGFLCKYVDTICDPTNPNEGSEFPEWCDPLKRIQELEVDVISLQFEYMLARNDDTYESKLYNRTSTLLFMKEAFEYKI